MFKKYLKRYSLGLKVFLHKSSKCHITCVSNWEVKRWTYTWHKLQFGESMYFWSFHKALCITEVVLVSCPPFLQAVLLSGKCRVIVCCVYVVPGRDAWPRTIASVLPFCQIEQWALNASESKTEKVRGKKSTKRKTVFVSTAWHHPQYCLKHNNTKQTNKKKQTNPIFPMVKVSSLIRQI